MVITQTDVEKALKAISRQERWGARVLQIKEDCDPNQRFILHWGLFQDKPWYFIPRHADQTIVPDKIEARRRKLEQMGFQIVADYIGHPVPDEKEDGEELEQEKSFTIEEIGVGVLTAIFVGLLLTAVVVLVVGMIVTFMAVLAALALVALPIAALAALIAWDPSLVVVIYNPEQSNFVYFEVGRWPEES